MASNSDAGAKGNEPAKPKEEYERMDPTNHPKLHSDPAGLQEKQDLSLMRKVNELKGSANEIGFSFRTDIDSLHSFYDETLQDFLQNVKTATLAEKENQKRAKQVEETRKKMQDLVNERNKLEKALREKNEAKKKAEAAAKKDEEAKKKDGEGDRAENKSQMGKSKVPAKQGVTTEPLPKLGGDLPDEKKPTDTNALPPLNGVTPKEPQDGQKPALPNSLGVPEEPKLTANKSQSKGNLDPEAAAKKELEDKQKKDKDEQQRLEQQKIAEEELEKKKQLEMQSLKDLEANLTESLEPGMSRHVVAKLSSTQAERLVDVLPRIKATRYSNNGRHVLAINSIGGLFLFDTGTGAKRQENRKAGDLGHKEFFQYLKGGNNVFKYFHVLNRFYADSTSGWSTADHASKLDAIFSPDDTEIFVYDAYTQVVLVYLVKEVIEHGFLVHPFYEKIRQIPNPTAINLDKQLFSYKDIEDRKEGEPRFVIPLRGFYEMKKNRQDGIRFMHFEKVVAGEQYFSPVDQDTLVIGTDEIVARILISRFNEPKVITNKSDKFDFQPEVKVVQNKTYSEIFESVKGRELISFAFTNSNFFYTQTKQKKDSSIVTLYKFNWEEFDDSDVPRLRMKRLNAQNKGGTKHIPFVLVVQRFAIASTLSLFPQTLSPTGSHIYGYSQKTNEIRIVDMITGITKKLLTLPPNRSGVSHMVVRHSGDYLLLVDTDGWFDIYNNNNELVEKGTRYSLLYSFFGVIETVLPTRRVSSGNDITRTHDYKLAELLAQGTGVFFFNNLNLYHYELDLPASNPMPAISKVPQFKNFVFFNTKANHTYEILQSDDYEGKIMQRVVDFGNWSKLSQPFFKPVMQRTIQEYEDNEHPMNFYDQPGDSYYVNGTVNFLKLMKEDDPNRLKQLPEINAQLIHLNCMKLAGSYEYEVKVAKNKSKVNFKLAVAAMTDEEGFYTIRRLADKHNTTLKVEDNSVWRLRISPDSKPEAYKDGENLDEEYTTYDDDDYEGDDTSHLFWNRYQGMYNFIPINDDGTQFLAPVKPFLKVFSVEKAIEKDKTKEKTAEDKQPALVKDLPLLANYGSVFWLSETLVGAILIRDIEIQTDLFVEWFPKGTKLTKGLIIYDLATKEEVKYHNIDFKIRDEKDEDLVDHDLKNVQVYPSGFKDLRFFITCDEVLTFDTQKKMFLYNTANIRDKQVVGILKGQPQFMPNYVYKSCSFQSSRNNSALALTVVQNPTFVRLYALPKLELLEEIQLNQGASNQPVRMCFSHDSKYFLVMTSATVISVYSVNLEKYVEPINLPEKIFRGLQVVDINLVQESSYLELCVSHKNHFLVYRLAFYPQPRDLLLGALQKQFRLYHQVSNALGSAAEQKRIAFEIAGLISLQYPHQICLDNTLLKILCCHTAKEPLEAYLNSLKDKQTVFKAAQLDVLAVVHEQVIEDNKDDIFELAEKKPTDKTSFVTAAKSSLGNHVLNSFIDAIGHVHEDQKRLPEISAKTIISWLSSKSLSSRYRTKLIELITFEPLGIIAKGALKSDTGMVSLIEARPPFEKTAKFVDTWSKDLMDPESANVDEFNTFITGIDFDLRNGSEFSLSYFNYLKEVSDEDLQLKYMGVIYYKWSQILYPATIYSFLYWILNGLITAFMGFSHTVQGLGWAIIVLNVIFISYEVKGISYDWRESWKDPWNYYDTISHSFTIIAVMILFKNPELSYELSWLRIVSFVLISFRGVMMLRIFAGTRYLLVMMLEVFNDMVAFLSIFFWMTFGYWFMCLTRPSLTVGGKDLELKEAIGQSLDIAFSNFNAGGLDTITLITTIIGQILIALILLNYLISIVSKTSERISEQRELYDIKMLLDIIREFDLVFNGFRSSKEARNARYLILRPRPTVDEEVREVLNLFAEEKERVELTFKTEVAKIEETVMENIENFNSKITETQQSIVELLRLINQQQAATSQKEMQDFIKRIQDLPRVVDLEKLEDDKKPPTQTKDKENDDNEDDLYYHESSDDFASSDQEGSLSESEDDNENNSDEDDEDDEDSDD